MSKILLLTPDAPPRRGGVARYIGATLRARPDVTLVVLPERCSTLGVLRSLVRAHGGYDAFWVHHIVPVGTACYLFSFVRRVPYTVFLHGLDFDLVRRTAWKRFLARRILARAERVVTNTEALSKEVSAFAHRDDVRVVYPCVSSQLVRASATVRKGLAHYAPEDLAKMLAVTLVSMTGAGVSVSRHDAAHEPLRLLTVGRLVERKGHAKVLRALHDLPNTVYTIVGDGPVRDSLGEMVRELGLGDRVAFLATVSDSELPALYAAHDVFVMPATQSLADREGFGIVYLEAGLFGLPCIATCTPGVDEAIVHGVTGFLIEDTPSALYDALRRLVASSRIRSRMGSAARARVLERFTEERFTDQVLGV